MLQWCMHSTKETILDLARQKGILRARDLSGQKLSRVLLSRLVGEGRLLKLSRGLYSLPDRIMTEQATLAEVAIKYPNSVFCLLTALQIHELTTQSPHQVWLAVDVKARLPQMDYPPLKVVRFSGKALESGIEDIVLDGVVQACVTCIEKTIVDCFKYRNKIGLDIAIEALQEAWRSKRMSMDKIWEFAKICRVTNVMRPYLESLNG
jgi:predicted transcriptional regulator of viral defense system